MIVGLIKPNEGQIYLDSKNITELPMYKRAKLGIGYLAQEASIFRKLTVEENLMAVLEMTDLPKQAQKDKMEDLLEEFSLTHVGKILASCFPEVKDEEPKLPGPWPSTLSSSSLMNLLPALTPSLLKKFNQSLPN
jgi:ABC-type glutathione transport system ATPase component